LKTSNDNPEILFLFTQHHHDEIIREDKQLATRNNLDFDQSNDSSPIILSHIPAKLLSIS